MPTVSVVITVYNGAKYLSKCLDSILAQTLSNIEIICVDDCSSDTSPQILSGYQDKIKILTNEKNCTAGESRNRGYEATSGEYVIFLDADDIFEPNMLEKAYVKAKSCDSDICIFKEDLFADKIEERTNYAYVEYLMDALGKRNFFSPTELKDMLFSLWNGWAWDKLFRRKFIVDTGLKFQKLKSSNDGFFVHAALASAHKISFVNEVLVHHRTGDHNSVSNRRDCAWESCLLYLKELKRYLVQRDLFSVFEKSYLHWTLDFLYWNYRTLNDINRKYLNEAVRLFLINDLNIRGYEKDYFYNAFSYWFADCIVKNKENKIPLTEELHFLKVYQLSVDKIEELKNYVSEHGWSVALWGAGIRGKAFAMIYGQYFSELKTAYDMDKMKQGKVLDQDIIIRKFERKQKKKTECIFVLNPAHLLPLCETLKDESLVLFDMNSYLTFPCAIDDCIVRCAANEING